MTQDIKIKPESWADPSIASTLSVGNKTFTKKKSITFDEGIQLTSGKQFSPLSVAYETFGTLAPKKDNVILITHALTGDSHCAGYYTEGDEKPGWWDPLIGPGKAFDTNKYFIVCSNCLGGCKGTTGPSSIDPKTGKSYALSFPVITIRDMVNTQRKLLDYLGIDKLLAVSGGSMGGMNVLEWAAVYPEKVRSIIPISTCGRLSPQGIAFSEVERQSIISDPHWNGGNYYGKELPVDGLAIARMIGHITYLSSESMLKKFGRRTRNDDVSSRFGKQFEIESYLHYQGDKFVTRFDANSYIYLTKAMDFYDIAEDCDTFEEGASKIKSKALFISFRSDWLFSPRETAELVDAIRKSGREADYHEIESEYGHDAFLVEYPKYSYLISRFLERVYRFYNS
ncbi:MAG: homoserine O-acetyltransferase [Chlamydiae bacterium]|nr:MAG: homoserine O-acetyltransferase [Chlamydiota bacterium]